MEFAKLADGGPYAHCFDERAEHLGHPPPLFDGKQIAQCRTQRIDGRGNGVSRHRRCLNGLSVEMQFHRSIRRSAGE